MSRKKSKHRQAVPAEVLAEGSDSIAAAPPDTEVVAAASEEVAAVTEPTTPAAQVEAKPAARDDKKKYKKLGKSKRTGRGEAADEVADSDSDSDGEAILVATDDETVSAQSAAGGAILADADAEALHLDDVASEDVRADGEAIETDELDGAGTELAVRGGSDAIDGDDVVGDPITDEAGVEAALLPGTLPAVQLRHLIEALIFATDKPVTLQRLRQLTRVADITRIEAALAELHEDYKERGIALTVVSGGYQFRTNTSFSSWVQQLIAGRPVRLSRAQLETLAIIAYRQPITRPEIDEIRGVDSSATLRLLLDRSLIRVLGKREEVGRPSLFGTTKEFLDFFSLGDLRELPTLREYSELTAESRQVMSERLGVPLDENGDLVEPETDLLDDGLTPAGGGPGRSDFTTDNASIVDSILAEHAAAEAEAAAEGRNGDASAMAEAAMSGGRVETFSEAFSESPNLDNDADAAAMSLSSDAATLGSSRSEARSYIDAIRSSSFVESHAEPEPEPDDVELKADSDLEAAGAEHTNHAIAGEVELTANEPRETDLGASGIEHTHLAGTEEVELAIDEPHVTTDLEASSIEHTDVVELAADEPLEPAPSVEHDDDVALAGDADLEASVEHANLATADEHELAADEPRFSHEPSGVELATSGWLAVEVSHETPELVTSSTEHASSGESDEESRETARIDLAHDGESDEAELAAEAALEGANIAHAAKPSESDATSEPVDADDDHN